MTFADRFIKEMGVPSPYKLSGGELMCLCHYHEETKPSLAISLTKGVFNCHGCGAHGPIRKLVQDVKGVGFMEAGRMLDEWGFGTGVVAPTKTIFEGMKESDYLAMHEKGWEDYAKGRGLDVALCRRFGFRFWAEEEALVIPIRDALWRLVGARFRKVTTLRSFWYNTGFSRQAHVYGLPFVASREKVFVVEGELDAVKMHQFGLPAVATFGTKVAPAQLDILKRFSELVVMFDMDAPGREGSETLVRALVDSGHRGVSELIKLDAEDPAAATKEVLDRAVFARRS